LNLKRKGRDISGILVLDKPSGMTSNGVLQKVKWLYQAQKAGHTGALDPIATGVLPICLGEATKFSQRLLESNKRYVTRVQFGESRDTGDIEGQTLETAETPVLSEQIIEDVLVQFRGEITQIPPMYSALKHEGRKLYELAREGIEFDIKSKARKVSILKLELLDFGADFIELDVTCTKGTYIRSLAEDISKGLGALGYVAVLRRLAAGPYQQEMMITLEELQALKPEGCDDYSKLDNRLLPTYTALESVPIIQVTLDQTRDLQFGRVIRALDAGDKPLPQVQLRLCHDQQDHLVGLGEMDAQGQIALKRLVKVPQLTALFDS
jgi:tRNA pseudouridine55 synthase